jgi:hypothetical protein
MTLLPYSWRRFGWNFTLQSRCVEAWRLQKRIFQDELNACGHTREVSRMLCDNVCLGITCLHPPARKVWIFKVNIWYVQKDIHQCRINTARDWLMTKDSPVAIRNEESIAPSCITFEERGPLIIDLKFNVIYHKRSLVFCGLSFFN